MTNRFLISAAAAALIAGTGFANAQGTGMGREAPSTGAATQQSAPSAAPMNRDNATESKGGDHGMKSTQSEEKLPQGSKAQRADEMKPGAKGEKSAQDNNKGEKSKSISSENEGAKGGSKDMKAEGREGRDRMNAEQKGAADSKSQTTTQTQTNQSQTTGQAGAGAKLSTEQRTKITTVIKEQRVAPVNNVNFSISVGTKVPRGGVSFHPLPASVVTIYPEWRGYEFILVRDQILVIDPRTLEIVAILEA